MSIDQLRVTNFRNLSSKDLVFHPKLNFFSGKNGSGKTSILEAIYYISTGRSFRSRTIDTIINRHCAQAVEFILYGHLSDQTGKHQIGISKSTIQPSQIRVNKQTVQTASQLAKISPTLLIDPLSFELLNGAPAQRRQFLDWGVFHVEHSFSIHWRNYINCLKQRNSLLRSAKIDRISLDVWDRKLAEFGELVHQLREMYFERFQSQLNFYLNYFSLDEHIKVSYAKGWDKSKQLQEALSQFREKDIERRFTQPGPHRADIKLTLYGHPAKENLSRGQQKLLIIAMYLAQIQTLLETQQRKTVVLIDDVTAELDKDNLDQVFKQLVTLDAQVIVTTLNDSVLKQLKSHHSNYKMFHVEHGQITELE